MSNTSTRPIAVKVTNVDEFNVMNEMYYNLVGHYAASLYPEGEVYFLMDFRGIELEDPNLTPDEYEYQVVTFEEYMN